MNTFEGIKVAEDITFRESQSDALSDVGRTHSSNESQTNDKPNLCRRVQGATVRGENLTQRRGSSLDRVEVNSTINTNRIKRRYQKGMHCRNGSETLSGDGM